MQLGDAVVDVGANIGFISAVVASSIGCAVLIVQVDLRTTALGL